MNLPISKQVPEENNAVDWLAIARLVIFIIALFALGFYFGGLIFYYHSVLIPNNHILSGSDLTNDQLQQIMNMLQLPIEFYAALNVILMAILGLAYVTVAILMLWFKPNDRMAVFTALVLILFGTGFPPVLEVYAQANPQSRALVDAWTLVGFTSLFILYYVFPDGHFIPRWTMIVAVFWVAQNVISTYWPNSPLLLFDNPEPWGSFFALVNIGTFIYAQVYRYHKVSDPVQRLQTKWVVVGLVTAIIGFVIPWIARLFWPQLTEPTLLGLLADVLTTLIYCTSFLLIPITIYVAINRYHLWNIDLLLRRTVIYSLLTLSLAAIYLGVVVVLQTLLERISGAGDSPVITVISTLAIAALFNPLHKRIQTGIDRRFYRHKLDTLQAMSAFHARMKTDVDLDSVLGALTQVVMDSIQPQSITIWIKPERPSRANSIPAEDLSVTISRRPMNKIG